MTADEELRAARNAIDILAKLPLAELQQMRELFCAEYFTTFSHLDDDANARYVAESLVRALADLRRNKARLGEVMGALRVLGVPVGY